MFPSRTARCRRAMMAASLAAALAVAPAVGSWASPPVVGGCPVFPSDNIWNTRVDSLPVAAASASYVSAIGSSAHMHPDFGSGEWPPGSGSPIGIPFVEVGASQPDVPITFTAYGSESDPGPYPVPPDAPIEGGSASNGDRHVLVVDHSDCTLYELYRAFPNGSGWSADSAARYDLRSNDLRPAGWTSADAAGLPIFPGLVRYDEVAAGRIDHALRFTAPLTQRAFLWPARHFASSNTSPSLPPMGARFRLRPDFDLSGYTGAARVILTALKEYGMILADNGSSWYLSGAPDPRWDNGDLAQLKNVPGSAFEAVDESSLMYDPDSGAAGSPVCVDVPGVAIDRVAGGDRYATAAALSQQAFPTGASTVYLATGERFPDALAAGPAAARAGAPVLLVRGTSLPAVTATEIKRLGASRAVIVGGDGAVSPSVAAAVAALGPTVVRLAGADRYATAVAIADDAFPAGASTVYVATGANFPDALGAGPAAAGENAPLLLVAGDRIPGTTAAALKRLAPTRIVVVGGTGVVDASVEAGLKTFAPVTRLAGADRYATAVAVSKASHPGSATTAYVATGTNFPDALGAGPVAAGDGAPLLLVGEFATPAATAAELHRLGPSRIVVVGGTGVIGVGAVRACP